MGTVQRKLITDYLLKNPNSNIYFHGSISKKELIKILPDFYASIIPLKIKNLWCSSIKKYLK